jgi:UDPglucose 6-dehydrogenase
MKVGIIGFGFVGDAVLNGLKKNVPHLRSVVYDPFKYPETKVDELKDCDLVFVCVPTPMNEDGNMDDSHIVDVLDRLSKIKYEGTVVVKSTVRPDILQKFIICYDFDIVANPEFLTERYAREDFLNQKWIIVGGSKYAIEPLIELYLIAFPEVPITITCPITAMLVKYMTNTFFATKVTLMNEFFNVAKGLGLDWDHVSHVLSKDERVGGEHLRVPGNNGEFGFGGKCLEKDSSALLKLMEKLGAPHDVVSTMLAENKESLHDALPIFH